MLKRVINSVMRSSPKLIEVIRVIEAGCRGNIDGNNTDDKRSASASTSDTTTSAIAKTRGNRVAA